MAKAKSSDNFERINFLYQAAHVLTSTAPNAKNIISFYGTCMKKIATKNLIKLNPDIKRTLCKKCDTLLIPGVTVKVRTRRKRGKRVVKTCLNCGQWKKYLCRKDYHLWSDQPEADVTKTKNQTGKNQTQEKSAG